MTPASVIVRAPTRGRARAALALALVLALAAGCSSAPARPVAPPRPAGAALGFPLYPMHLTATEGVRGPFARVDLELRPDGALVWRGEATARLNGARVADARARELFAAGPDGHITLARGRHHAQIREDGALIVDDAERIYFDDQGRVASTRPGHPPRWLGMQITGLRPDALRTGALMVVYVMVQTRRL